MQAVYLLSFPREMVNFIRNFEFLLTIDVVSLGIPLECLGISGYYDKLRALAAAPAILLLLAVVVSFGFVVAQAHKYRDSVLVQAQMGAKSARVAMARHMARETLLTAAPRCLWILFLTLPLVSSVAFRGFSCECFDELELCYLRADYDMVCGARGDGLSLDHSSYTAEYKLARRFAWGVVAVYPVAVPLLFTALLFRVRHTILARKQTRFSQALSFLHGTYEPRFFYWEVRRRARHVALRRRMPRPLSLQLPRVRWLPFMRPGCPSHQVTETIRKVYLVGFATFIYPGTIVQLIAALIVSLSFFALQMQAQPYKENFDDILASAMQLATTAMFICCVLLKVRGSTPRAACAGRMPAL